MKTRKQTSTKKVAKMICILAVIMTIAIIALPLAGCGGNDTVTETFTVTFNANGGSPTPEPQTIEKGKTATEPTGDKAPIKTNYTLDGWYKEIGLSTKWNFATDTVTANIDLYAKWNETQKKPEDTPKTVTFDKDYSVTIISDDQFAAAEWETICDDVVTALETAYGAGNGASKSRFRSVIGQEEGIKIVLEKNPTDYTNYKVGSDFKVLYLNVENIASINYGNAIAAMAAKDSDDPLMKD